MYTKFKDFLINEEAAINSAVSKVTKDTIDTLEKQVSDYKSKKSQVDSIYTNTDLSETELTAKTEQILGKDKEKRNPFLVQYIKIANYKRQLVNLSNTIKDNNEKLSDYNTELSEADEENKAKIKEYISNLNTKNNQITSDISNLKTTIEKSEKEMEDEMNKKIDELKKKGAA